MKANVSKIHDSDRIAMHRKENGFYRQISILDRDTGHSIVTARFYWPGRDGASNCYACVWVHGDNCHGRGGSKAGGYGYHKESAAISEALHDAGITFNEPFDGHGDSAMYDALESVARAVTGKRKFFRVLAHA